LKNKKTIHIKYVDYWHGFDYRREYFWNLLSAEYNVIYSEEEPDYIIYSNYGLEHLNYDCIKIFVSYENERPNFDICDFAITSDYCNKKNHYQLPVFATILDKQALINTDKDALFEDWKSRKEFCSFVVSNGKCQERIDFFNFLRENYIKVRSGGKILNNVGGTVSDKLEFLRKHKFNIAFENSSYPGYLTEKITDAFVANTIPIYWGDIKVSQYFNEKRFIRIDSYSSNQSLLTDIKRIMTNDELAYSIISQPIFVNDSIPKSLEELNIVEFFAHIFNTKVYRSPIVKFTKKIKFKYNYFLGKLPVKYYGKSESFR